MPCSLRCRLGGVSSRHAVRTVVRTMTPLRRFIFFVGPSPGWKLVLGLLGSWVRTVAASICAAFRLALGGSVLFAVGLVRLLSFALSALLCGVGGSTRLSFGAVNLRLLTGACRALRSAR